MEKTKQKRDIIENKDFSNAPVEVSFDYDPATAKGFEQDNKFSDTGKSTKYPISVNQTQIFFATEALYAKIKDFGRGDKVSISFYEKRWVINKINVSDGGVEKAVQDTETNVLLRSIKSDVEEIKNHLYGSKEKTTEYPKDEDTPF